MRIFLHLPINHRYRGLYRFLAGLTGLYVVVLGVVGLAVSWGHGVFARDHVEALGLRTNIAFSVLSILVGAAVVIGVLVDNNWDHILNLFGGLAFLIVGMLMLVVMQTDLNLLNFTVAKCVVSFLIGLVLLTAGLYSRVGSPDEDEAEERHRHAPPESLGGRTRRPQTATS
jgi:hypothetical protein